MKRRLFIGIDLPQEIKQKIGSIIVHLIKEYPNIRWENPDKLHLTLKFLGYTSVVPEKILQILQKNLTSQAQFNLIFGKLDKFARRSTIVFWGIKENRQLKQLYFKVNQALKIFGFPRENHPFHPHLTLGRSKERIAEIKPLQIDPPGIKVSGISLFESKLSKEGSVYTKLGDIYF